MSFGSQIQMVSIFAPNRDHHRIFTKTGLHIWFQILVCIHIQVMYTGADICFINCLVNKRSEFSELPCSIDLLDNSKLVEVRILAICNCMPSI